MKVKKTPESKDLFWSTRILKSEAPPKTAHRGPDIQPGNRFIRFYKATEYDEKGAVSKYDQFDILRSKVSFCDLCRVPIFEERMRFCCAEHAEEHLRRENIEFEEYMFDRGMSPGRIY